MKKLLLVALFAAVSQSAFVVAGNLGRNGSGEQHGLGWNGGGEQQHRLGRNGGGEYGGGLGSNGGGLQSQASQNMDACVHTGGKWMKSSSSPTSNIAYYHCVCPTGSRNGLNAGGNYCVKAGLMG